MAGAAVTPGAVLIVGGRTILALAPDTGEPVWSWQRNPGPAGTPAVEDELVYHASGLGEASALVARRIGDGREIWRAFVGSSMPDGPTLDGDTVYVVTDEGLLLAVDARTGEERWRFEADASIEGSPAVGGDRVLVSAQNQRTGTVTVHAVDEADGTEAWRFTAPRALPGTAVAATADAAFVGLSDGRIVRLDADDGNVRWAVTPQDFFVPGVAPAVTPDLLISDRLHLYLFDAAEGTERWVFRLADLRLLDDGRTNTLTSSPVATNGSALIADASGVVSAIDLRSGRRVWKADAGDGPVASVAAGPDAVYLTSTGRNGEVVALEHDPNARLTAEVSPTVLFPGRALLTYAAAALLVGAVILAVFRLLDRLRPANREEEQP